MTETRLPARALRLVDGAPDISSLPCDRLTGSDGEEYMRRFYLRRGRGSNARFHRIVASDPGRDFHDQSRGDD